jgi:integrase
VVRWWRSNGLSPGTLTIYLQWVHRFRSYCKQRALDEMSQLTLEGAHSFARAYRGARKRRPSAAQSQHVACNALHAWACALRSLKVPFPPWRAKRPPLRLAPLLAAYYQHRRCDCEVAEATLKRDLRTAEAFLGLLRSQGKAISRTTVADVDSFIVGLSKHVSRRTVRDRGSSLRSFLRFLRMTDRMSRDLASSVVTPRIRFAERPPRALPWPQVRRILGSIPQTQPPGKRDFAMLLAMAT